MEQFNPIIAERVAAVAPSATLAVTAKAKALKAEGKNVINLAAGEPDFNTPQFIIDAAAEAMNNGMTKYTPVAGLPQLRKIIAEKLQRENGLDYTPEQITVTVGAKHALYNVFQTILNPGDEVLLPNPSWVSYKEMATLASAVAVQVPTSQEDEYALHVEELEKALTSKTKAIVINSPCNPTGSVYSKSNLQQIADFAIKNKLIVISDEIYEKLTYSGSEFVSIGSLSKEILAQTVTINGLSKSYSMTGWRVGYLAGPEAIVKGVNKLQSHCTSNATTFCQNAAITALEDKSDLLDQFKNRFEKRRDLICEGLNKIDGLKCHKPGGAFYVFPDISAFLNKEVSGKMIRSSLDFCSHLLETQHVATVPGSAFGAENNIRLSYATSEEDLKIALERIELFLKG